MGYSNASERIMGNIASLNQFNSTSCDLNSVSMLHLSSSAASDQFARSVDLAINGQLIYI